MCAKTNQSEMRFSHSWEFGQLVIELRNYLYAHFCQFPTRVKRKVIKKKITQKLCAKL